MKALIYDTETTGLVKHPNAKMKVQPRIIEFGAVLVDLDGEVFDEWSLIVNPEQEIEPIITKITGLTQEDLNDKPNFAAARPEIERAFAAADVMIAHNLPFDYDIIQLELTRHDITDWPWPRIGICTVQEHFEEFGRRYKLTELYKHYMQKPLAQTHRALDDVNALAEVCVAANILESLRP